MVMMCCTLWRTCKFNKKNIFIVYESCQVFLNNSQQICCKEISFCVSYNLWIGYFQFPWKVYRLLNVLSYVSSMFKSWWKWWCWVKYSVEWLIIPPLLSTNFLNSIEHAFTPIQPGSENDLFVSVCHPSTWDMSHGYLYHHVIWTKKENMQTS